jgi:hypothetical protein
MLLPPLLPLPWCQVCCQRQAHPRAPEPDGGRPPGDPRSDRRSFGWEVPVGSSRRGGGCWRSDVWPRFCGACVLALFLSLLLASWFLHRGTVHGQAGPANPATSKQARPVDFHGVHHNLTSQRNRAFKARGHGAAIFRRLLFVTGARGSHLLARRAALACAVRVAANAPRAVPAMAPTTAPSSCSRDSKRQHRWQRPSGTAHHGCPVLFTGTSGLLCSAVPSGATDQSPSAAPTS